LLIEAMILKNEIKESVFGDSPSEKRLPKPCYLFLFFQISHWLFFQTP